MSNGELLIQNFKIDEVPDDIFIGYRGENRVRKIIFDVTAWNTLFGDPSYSITFRNKYDKDVYKIYDSDCIHDGNTVEWVISNIVTLIPDSYGTFTVRCSEDGKKRKSIESRFHLDENQVPSPDLPEPYIEYMDKWKAISITLEKSPPDEEPTAEIYQDSDGTHISLDLPIDMSGYIEYVDGVLDGVEKATADANEAATNAINATGPAAQAIIDAGNAADLANGAANTANIAAAGAIASTRYQHIRYSMVENPTDEQMILEGGNYMGTCVTSSPVAPTSASLYTWSKIIGDIHYATFEVDVETGHLIMNTPEFYDGPTFALVNGNLEVMISD